MFKDFLWGNLFSFKDSYDSSSPIFLGVKKMSSKKFQKMYSRIKSHEGKRLQIWVGYLDWRALQKIKTL